MPGPATFDAFYREARGRLLAQALVLTGDLAVATSVTLDVLAQTWSRWDDAEERADREVSARRAVTTRSAQRHRGPAGGATTPGTAGTAAASPSAATTAATEALAVLSGAERQVLALTGPAGVSAATAAGDLGISEDDARQVHERAVARLREALTDPTGSPARLLSPVTALARDAAWPSARRVRRGRHATGSGRGVRRAAVATLTLVVGAGAVLVAADVGPVRSTLAGAGDRVAGLVGDTGQVDDAPSVPPSTVPSGEELLPESTLLPARRLARAVPGVGGWAERATGDNSSGNGLVLPCQQERYADPSGEASLVRTYRAGTASKPPSATAVQLSEASSSERAARRAYQRVVAWVGGCSEARTQLLATRTVTGAGDAGRQLVLRTWGRRPTTTVVGIARTGMFTTATATSVRGRAAPDARAHARLQAAAVAALCDLDGAGPCPARVRLRPSPPPRTGEPPAMLSEVDLPPVRTVSRVWVGTPSAPPRTNAAASGCDEATFTGRFRGARWQHGATRTFLVPQAQLPAAFGLTETVGALPRARAGAFVDRVRSRLASCSEREAGTSVERLAGFQAGPVSLHAWELRTEVADRRSTTLQMAVARRGTAVAQIGFVPTGGAEMGRRAFVDLARRALARLEALPAPRSAATRGGGR